MSNNNIVKGVFLVGLGATSYGMLATFVKLAYNKIVIHSSLIGKYNYTNIAAAITIGEYFKVVIDEIKNAIESYVPTNNRSQIIKTVNKFTDC